MIRTMLEAVRLMDEGWTTGCHARDAEGIPCPTLSPEAVAFCPAGALYRATGSITPIYLACIGAIQDEAILTGYRFPGITQWGDVVGYPNVRDVFERAIEREQTSLDSLG